MSHVIENCGRENFTGFIGLQLDWNRSVEQSVAEGQALLQLQEDELHRGLGVLLRVVAGRVALLDVLVEEALGQNRQLRLPVTVAGDAEDERSVDDVRVHHL